MLTYYNQIKTLLISNHTALHIVVLPSHVSTVTCATTLHILFNQYKFSWMSVCLEIQLLKLHHLPLCVIVHMPHLLRMTTDKQEAEINFKMCSL